MTLIAKNRRILSTPDRKKCLLKGGHPVYYNSEFGNLWCYRCGSVWKADGPVVEGEEGK